MSDVFLRSLHLAGHLRPPLMVSAAGDAAEHQEAICSVPHERHADNVQQSHSEQKSAWQREGPSAEEVQTLLTLEQRTYESQMEENTFWQELIAGCYQGRSWQKVRASAAVRPCLLSLPLKLTFACMPSIVCCKREASNIEMAQPTLVT